MPTPANLEELFELIDKSGVAEDPKLRTMLAGLKATGELAADPKHAATQLIQEGVLTQFQAEQLMQGKWKRFSIGKYKVLEKIGAGGMGQVFLCEHKLMRRRVAIKVLPTVKGSDPSALERFYREARAVAAVDHPNIVRAYDIDQDEHLHFLVMEFVDGVNLHDLVRKSGPLAPNRAAHYICGAGVGLQHAHEIGLVHRDIKPSNILVDRMGVVKILDMGLARFFNDDEESLTQKYDENILGTADYLAPEQAIDSHGADIRADIYSLGCTFHYLLTGKPPFPEGNVTQKLLWHQQREPLTISHYRNDVAPELQAIVHRMMKKDPANRYQGPSELLAELAPWVTIPIAPPEPAELPTLSRAARGSGGPITSRVMAGAQVLGHSHSGTGIGGPTGSGTSGHSFAAFGGPASTVPLQQAPTKVTPQEIAAPADLLDFSSAAPAPVQRAKGKEPAKSKPAGVGKPRSRRLPLLIGAGVFVAAGLVSLAALGVHLALPRGTHAIIVEDAKTWYVSKSPRGTDPNRTLTTLAGAIDQAKVDDVILIMDERLDEPPIRISDAGKNAKRGLNIKPGPGLSTVYWAPKYGNAKGGPAFEAVYIESFTLSGITFELGGIGDCAVSVGFNSPGLTLENLVVRNPRKDGIRLMQLKADPSRPARILGCRIVAGSPCESGIAISAGNHSIAIVNNRFEGPGAVAVRIDGTAQDCEVRNNRMRDFETGVRLTGRLSTETPYSLTVSQNTIHGAANAGFISDHALGGSKHQVQLMRNLLVEVNQIVGGNDAKHPGLRTADNAHDPKSKEGIFNSRSVRLDTDLGLGTNADNEAGFLRGNGNLRAVGPNKVDVGYMPE